jgi:hypothetical protein
VRGPSDARCAGIRSGYLIVCACVSATLTPAGIAVADPPQGAIVGWGEQVFGADLSGGFVAVAAGGNHSLGLKADGSIVAWGCGTDSYGKSWDYGQCNVPAPNSGFIAVAAGKNHSLAIRRVTGDADGDGDVDRADFAAFVDDMLGPSADPQLPGWQFFNVDMDDDVDLRDLGVWQNAFTGP